MTIKVALKHETRYQYERAIELSPQIVRLKPAPHCRTPVHGYSLKIAPQPHFINWQQDPFSNFLARLIFPEKVKEFHITVDVIAEMTVINPLDFFLEEKASQFPFEYEPSLHKELAPYLEIQESGSGLKQWLKEWKSANTASDSTINVLAALNKKVEQDTEYVIRLEPGIQTCEETLSSAKGSCRDSAWLLVQILRHLGLAARFVSGYLIQLTPDVKALDGPSGTEVDFTDLHAWTEVYLPGAGWIGLDSTSGLFAGEGHLPLACTPHPTDAAPITGSAEPCKTEFSFHMEIQRIHEDPRVTKPYTEEQWKSVEALAGKVDQFLEAEQVGLTMGGEPTFVSIDEPDAAEWNIAAHGKHKWNLSMELLRRLHTQFAPGGVLHYGQGKWYPGEALPRWALGCFWRRDGKAVWKNSKLLADTENENLNSETAFRFAETLADNLSVSKENIEAAYEDIFHSLWQEGTLPENIDPLKHDLEKDDERQRLRQLLQQGLGSVKGYALPLTNLSGASNTTWLSNPWTFRQKRLYLLPGDSAMGYRLPLNSLIWEPPEKRQKQQQEDPMAPSHQENQSDDEDVFVRTALCIEVRNGFLCIFLPPVSHFNAWLELISSIEKTANSLKLPIRLEGYEAPKNNNLLQFKITPDPGVIEVNIHPSQNWGELVKTTEILYEEARLNRLATEKFMVDGRHTGTGGGNHVTLGSNVPAESPFLLRPDLLRSLVTFWQNHPSLSYLFSGMFIGPTSQAPRVDEARDESLYELNIAFQQIDAEENPLPWFVDRSFRHLLIDVTGNAHRAEFCIDKLFSPDSYSGRQGLVEMRAFEMPPHPRMSLLQMLLLRALIACFWKKPYRQALIPWHTELHDRFMLPHFVREDFQDVLNYLKSQRYPFKSEWFAPFYEFRFPSYGTVQIGDTRLELRMALEPWNVLGEEVTLQGTSRFVDSSVERLQIQLEGFTPSRYFLTCNQRKVPLRPTGTRGQYVAGIRFRAWDLPSALHPRIPVHSPLIFDLVDALNLRSIGGCTYHVSHPGGRNYETRPVNANEAEARRVSRFMPSGHTAGRIKVSDEKPNPWCPYTLDLRVAPENT
ncbi:MAG: transglutaminase family protein [SAR324 cluster bacterium]|nr:transglutaminase family protein [SAR324 cluster bacterium]